MYSLFYKKYYFSKQTLRRKKKEKSTMTEQIKISYYK